jgi:hypothetical protein
VCRWLRSGCSTSSLSRFLHGPFGALRELMVPLIRAATAAKLAARPAVRALALKRVLHLLLGGAAPAI